MAIKGEREKYNGIGMKQKKGIIEVFSTFFADEKFDIIIEIGTGSGAFSVIIAEKAKEMRSKFYTFDIKLPELSMMRRLTKLGVIFSKESIDSNNIIEDIINNNPNSRLLILNDALKEKHLKRFAEVIKPGDCILSHDYGTEYTIKDVNAVLKKNNLKVSYEKLFRPEFLWLCCIKSEE